MVVSDGVANGSREDRGGPALRAALEARGATVEVVTSTPDAVGLARMFYTAARMDSALAHGSDPLALHRPLDDKAYSFDHIVTKLDKLPGKMQTPAGRALATQRLQILLDFRATFAEEWGTAA